jgi:hypothetical protein
MEHIMKATDLMYFEAQRGSNPHSCARGGSCFEISFCTIIRMYYILMNKYAGLLSDSYVPTVAAFDTLLH